MASSLVVQLEDVRYALPMVSVSRVVRAVEVDRFPAAPQTFLGIVDIAGEVVPVVNLRRLLGHHERPLEVDDVMVDTETSRMRLVLPVDRVLGIFELDETTHTQGTSPSAQYIDSFLCYADGMVLGLDVDRLVSEDDCLVFVWQPGTAVSS